MMFFIGIVFLACIIGQAQKIAKKKAKTMITEGIENKKEAEKILKILSSCRDNEGKRLYSKLADLAGV